MKKKTKHKVTYDEKGFSCQCGKRHDHPGYVYAHFREGIVHTCDCGRKHTIKNGVVKDL
jgi:hypothetical protein